MRRPSLPGAAAPYGGAGVQDVVPCEPRFARPISRLRLPLSERIISGVRNAARAVEHHPRRAPDGEPPSPHESQIELEQVLEQEAANKPSARDTRSAVSSRSSGVNRGIGHHSIL